MAKIFLSFFSCVSDPDNEIAIPCFYETFIQELVKNGNEIFAHISREFNSNYKDIPQDLLSDIQNFNPDIIFLFNNAFYDISKYFECPIFVYEVDSPLFYSNKEALKENIDRYKFIVIQEESGKVVQEHYNASGKNILVAPFFSEIQNEKLDIKQNICFIGTNFSPPLKKTPFSQFMLKNPTEDEAKLYKKLLITIQEKPFLTNEELFDQFNVTSELVKSNFNVLHSVNYISGYIRTKTLSNIANLGLKIYGTKNWIDNNYNEPFLVLSYDNKLIYTIKQNQNVYNSSKIGININHLQATQAFSWRVCDIMASNACLVSEYKPDLVKNFKGVNLPLFNNPYEARELCIKLLNNENMRQDIVAASNEIINKKFRFKNIKKLIEDYFDISLSGENGSVKFVVQKIKTAKLKLKNRIYLKCYEKLEKKLKRKGLIAP